MGKVQITRPKLLTILLFLFALYVVWSTWNYYSLKTQKWDECNVLQEKIVPNKYDFQNTVVYSYEHENTMGDWTRCIDNYGNLFMMYEMNKILLVVSFFMVLLSWKIDSLKTK